MLAPFETKPANDLAGGQEPSRPETLLNPELSLLAFHERVLAQASRDAVPLLERLKFLSI
jgi:polyphosphate kinase